MPNHYLAQRNIMNEDSTNSCLNLPLNSAYKHQWRIAIGKGYAST